MAGFIPSFLSSSKVAIRIGSTVIAFAQNVSMSDDMSVTPVGQIGSYNMLALEPTNYIARGTMTVTHYSNVVLNALKQADANLSNAPSNLAGADTSATSAQDGNSLLIRDYFSPVNLMLSRTFDLDFYERMPDQIVTTGAEAGKLIISNFGSNNVPEKPIYRMENARLSNYNMSFTPGSLVNETVAIIATGLLDSRAGEITKSEG